MCFAVDSIYDFICFIFCSFSKMCELTSEKHVMKGLRVFCLWRVLMFVADLSKLISCAEWYVFRRDKEGIFCFSSGFQCNCKLLFVLRFCNSDRVLSRSGSSKLELHKIFRLEYNKIYLVKQSSWNMGSRQIFKICGCCQPPSFTYVAHPWKLNFVYGATKYRSFTWRSLFVTFFNKIADKMKWCTFVLYAASSFVELKHLQ